MKGEANRVTGFVIGACIEVHRELGPGLLETVYEEALFYQLTQDGVQVERQAPVVVHYKGQRLKSGLAIDLLVENLVIVELKTVDKFHPVHEAQLLTYLKLRQLWLGLLVNFNVPLMKNGIRRIVN